MRHFLVATALAAVLAAPAVASAQSFEVSLGSGVQVLDTLDNERLPTNIMVAVGYGGLPIVEPQLGIIGDLGDVSNADFDLQIRPQVKISLPVLPVYGRVIVSVVNLLGDGDVELFYGGGLGFELPIPFSPFIEAAYLPTSAEGLTVVEARLGFGF